MCAMAEKRHGVIADIETTETSGSTEAEAAKRM